MNTWFRDLWTWNWDFFIRTLPWTGSQGAFLQAPMFLLLFLPLLWLSKPGGKKMNDFFNTQKRPHWNHLNKSRFNSLCTHLLYRRFLILCCRRRRCRLPLTPEIQRRLEDECRLRVWWKKAVRERWSGAWYETKTNKEALWSSKQSSHGCMLE